MDDAEEEEKLHWPLFLCDINYFLSTSILGHIEQEVAAADNSWAEKGSH